MPFALLFSLALGACLVHGATHNVGAGQSIQSAIDGAASGDTIVLTAPTEYAGHLTINGKAFNKAMSDQTNIVATSPSPEFPPTASRSPQLLTGNADANARA